jgi:hypothetical protein
MPTPSEQAGSQEVNSMDLFDRWKPNCNRFEELRAREHGCLVRRVKPCSRCNQREETALCICGDHLCTECTGPHLIDELCPALQLNPDLWVQWDETLRVYYVVGLYSTGRRNNE